MMTAFLLGAGLGTRLRPLTEHLPKPLIPVANQPLVTYALDHLIAAGWERFLINTHHCPRAWARCLGGDGLTTSYRDCPVHFRHEPTLLETGGGLKNMEDMAGGDDLLLYNADTLQDLDVLHLARIHREQGNVVTMGLRSFGGPLAVRCDPASGAVLDIGDRLGVVGGTSYLFTGVYMVSPEIFAWIPPHQVISIIPVLLELLRAQRRVSGVVLDKGHWMDLGTPAAYLEAHRWLASASQPWSHPGAKTMTFRQTPVPASAQVRGFLSTGTDVNIGSGAILEDCVLWDGASVAPGAHLTRCVVRTDSTARGTAMDAVF